MLKISPLLFIATRDPTDKDIDFIDTIWISKEYHPNRVFRGEKGKWMFIGKFYPQENKC